MFIDYFFSVVTDNKKSILLATIYFYIIFPYDSSLNDGSVLQYPSPQKYLQLNLGVTYVAGSQWSFALTTERRCNMPSAYCIFPPTCQVSTGTELILLVHWIPDFIFLFSKIIGMVIIPMK